MNSFVVMNTSSYVQYKVVHNGIEYKVYSMNGSEARVSYDEIERGLQSGKYKKI